MIYLPLLLTLFPYTTLFRSVFHESAVAAFDIEHERLNAFGDLFAHDGSRDERDALHRGGNVAQRVEQFVGRCNFLGLPDQDRKSTRLNSSHQIISYAVLCLK